MNKKSRLLILFIILFGMYFVLNQNISYAVEILPEELAVAKENGMVSALCYVYDIASGALAKAIIAMFLIVVGWMFFIGFIKWFLLFSFMVAVSLTFGGVQLANIISGNNYSCEDINNAIKTENDTIYNAGDCSMVNNELYSTGQVWYKCSTSILGIEKCDKEIDNNTTINIGDVISLGGCQGGYFKKDSSKLLKYKCITNGKFELQNESDYSLGKCYQGCLESDLKMVADSYNFCNNGVGDCKFDIKGNGKLTSYNGKNYYVYDTILNANCINDNYTEFDTNYIANIDGAIVKCYDSGKYIISGSCKKNCDISLTEPIKNVKNWYKCTDDKCSIKENTDKKSFSIYNKIAIANCNTGYSLKEGDEKPAVFECSDLYNGWISKSELGSNICQKTCYIDDLMSGSEWYYYDNLSGKILNIINKTEFFSEEYIIANSCKNGYSSNTNTKLIRKCNSKNIWEDVNEGSLCYKNCLLNSLIGIENVNEFKITNKITNESNIINNINDHESIKNTDNVTISSCKTGYYVDENVIYNCSNGNLVINNKKPCLKGCLFNSVDDPDLLLNNVSQLKSMEPNSYENITIDGYYNDGSEHKYNVEEDGKIIEKTIICNIGETHDACKKTIINQKPIYLLVNIENNGFSKQEVSYKIDKCKEGYKIKDNESAIITCNYDGKWERNSTGYLCIKSED